MTVHRPDPCKALVGRSSVSHRRSTSGARDSSAVKSLQTLAFLGFSIFILVRCGLRDTDRPDSAAGRTLLEYSGRDVPCAGVSKIHDADRCGFVKQHCKTGSLINYLQVYYCHVEPAGWTAKLGFQVLCIFAMALLFRVLSTTAEDYFSPILTQMSKDFYLPPRLAGVTLMAWGNGAPDIFSSMAAVKEGEYALALGGQLGAGMFIGTVVLGAVVGASKGASVRGALIRDVSAYALAVAMVAWILGSGQVTKGKALLLLGGYVVYVLAVCAADITHRVRRRSQESIDLSGGDDSKDLETGLLTPPDSPLASPRLQPGGLPPVAELPLSPPARQLSKGLSDSGGRLSDTSCIELQLQTASDLSGSRQLQQQQPSLPAEHLPARRAASLGGGAHDPLPPLAALAAHARRHTPVLSPPLTYSDMVHMPGSKYRERAWAALSDSPSFRRLRVQQEDAADAAVAGEGSGYRPPRLHSRASVDNAYLDTALEGPPAPASGVAAQQMTDAVSPHIPAAATDPLAAEGGNSGSGSGGASGRCARRLSERSWLQAAHYATLRGFVEQHLLQRMLVAVSVLEWPLTVARRGTIPLLEQECYSRPWLIASLVGGPVAIAVYFHAGVAGLVLAAAVGGVAAAGAWYTTQGIGSGKDCPPDWDCGTGVPIGAVAVALAGFAVACMWIDTVASELVGLLRFFGVLAQISSLVLGLTVLAWGNSIPDLITDVAMARTGFGNMAITACFAGPLCNILNGLGVGFLLLLESGGRSGSSKPVSFVDVQLSTPVLTDAIIVCGNCALVLVLGLLNSNRLPACAGLLLTCMYGLYLAINLVVHYM